jgi:hypothetical protein
VRLRTLSLERRRSGSTVKPRGRPHLVGIDDGPFEKAQAGPVPIVAVMMECPDLIEGVAQDVLPVDAGGATEHIARWVGGMRCMPGVDAIVLGGITIAGLAVLDVERLARLLERPVIVVNRRDPADHRLDAALAAAGRLDRLELVRRTPPARRVDAHLFVACAGATWEQARNLVLAARHKSALPEPLRVAHLIAAAIARGESRGRA